MYAANATLLHYAAPDKKEMWNPKWWPRNSCDGKNFNNNNSREFFVAFST